MISKILKYTAIIIFAALFVFPFYWMFVGSLKTFREFYLFPPVFFPPKPQWTNYIESIKVLPLLRYIMNTLFMAFAITVCQLISTSSAGFAFATMNFKGRDTIFMLFLVGMMVPFTVILTPLFLIIKTLGWIDNYLALIVPFVFSAYGIFLMRQFFKGIPKDLYEAAIVEGCSEYKIYYKIYLPLSGPVLATLGIQCFVFFYNNLLWPLVVINKEELKTIAVGLLSFIGRDSTSPQLIMAGATLCVIPTLILFIVLQKYFVKGIVMTGLKA